MKKTCILILMALGLGMFSCEEQLDILPIGTNTPNEQMATAEGTEAALLACYSDQNLHELWLNSLDAYGDMGMNLSVATPLWQLGRAGNWVPSHSTNIWDRTYPEIARCNFFLNDVEEFDAVFRFPGRKEQAMAEARALRAYRYFRLVQCFGPVPLVLETNMDNWYPVRASELEVYQQIIDDLNYAITHLPVTPPGGLVTDDPSKIEWGRVTKYAAMSALAKVYMTAPDPLKNYQTAATLFEQVIGSGQYALLPTWTNLFNPNFRSGENNPEMIWPVMFTNAFQGGGTKIAFYSTTSQSWMRPSNEMYDKYEASDVRRDATILKGFRENFLEKYMQGLAGDERDNHPFYAIRYADVLLCYAECLTVLDFNANKSLAVDLINQVRQRAGATPKTAADFATREELIEFLMDEFHRELYFEGHYWFTMKRNGVQLTLRRQKIDPTETFRFILPLPPTALRTNANLVQNTGYSDE